MYIWEPEITAGRGTRSYEEIERLQANFHRSVNGMLSVDPGPPLEGPMSDEEIENLALEVKEEING